MSERNLARPLVPRRVPRPRAVAALTVAAALTAVLAPAAAQAAPAPRAPGAPPVPVLRWHPCDGGFQCATARVPLDYRQPHGATIRLAVLRHRATQPARRIGSLFVNGGGPNEQIEGVLRAYHNFPAALRQRFDIITFDPRGFGYSTAIRCFPSQAAESKLLSGLPPFPVGAKQDTVWIRTYARFDRLCAQRNGPLLDHDSTADVARDMDLLRQAVHAPALNYLGLSYGSGLGATYANLFPARVGRMILDGNVNPVSWTHPDGIQPVFVRLGSGRAAAASMTAFLNLCGATTTANCAFSAGSPAATRARWQVLLRRVRRHPVSIGSPPQRYTYADVIASVPLGQVSAWPAGAALLQQLWTASAPASASAAGTPAASTGASRPAAGRSTTAAAALTGAAAAAAPLYTGLEQNLAVLCSDTANPRDPRAYQLAARLAYPTSGGFGAEQAWATEPCADWPDGGATDRYTGPWNRPTANTLLLLGNTGDPALPYRDSVAMEHDLARARLLTVAGYGHTEANNPSSCALGYEISYLETGALPPPGTVCREDTVPFDTVPFAPAGS
jgi:pimeloyl-ACP methyl ester carboxylesterase